MAEQFEDPAKQIALRQSLAFDEDLACLVDCELTWRENRRLNTTTREAAPKDLNKPLC